MRLDDDHRGVRAGTSRRARTVEPRPPSAGSTTHSATGPRRRSRPHARPGAAADRGGVPALGAGQELTSDCQRPASARKTGRPSSLGAARASGSGRSAAVEGVPQPGEEPCWPGREPAGRRSSPRSLASSRSSSSCSASSLAGVSTVDVDDQVAAAGAVQVPDALAVERDDLAGLGARPDVDLLGAVQRLHRQRRARARPPPSGSSPCSAGRRPAARRSRAAAARSPGTGRRAGRRPGRSRPRRPAGCGCRPRRRPGSAP